MRAKTIKTVAARALDISHSFTLSSSFVIFFSHRIRWYFPFAHCTRSDVIIQNAYLFSNALSHFTIQFIDIYLDLGIHPVRNAIHTTYVHYILSISRTPAIRARTHTHTYSMHPHPQPPIQFYFDIYTNLVFYLIWYFQTNKTNEASIVRWSLFVFLLTYQLTRLGWSCAAMPSRIFRFLPLLFMYTLQHIFTHYIRMCCSHVYWIRSNSLLFFFLCM